MSMNFLFYNQSFYCLILSLFWPARWYTLHISRVADTLCVKLFSFVASLIILRVKNLLPLAKYEWQCHCQSTDPIILWSIVLLFLWLLFHHDCKGFINTVTLKYVGYLVKDWMVIDIKYAILVYSSAIAKTTSSSYFFVNVSKNGSKLFLIASCVIRVATIGTLWMVLTLDAKSSDSSYYLNN